MMDMMEENSDTTTEPEMHSRLYQMQLEEIAVAKNTIIHLPTGSGKTFIAIQVINRLSDAVKKPWGMGGKRTFFLVNNVPLVKQQKEVIQHHTTVKNVAGYSSEDRVDYWNKSKWDEELVNNQIIVMTTQILADMLTHGYIKIEDLNLLIFDECHHAVVDHPMRLVMKHFDNCPPEKHPRVIGLTATLLNSNVPMNKIPDSLRELETTFHSTIATVNRFDDVFRFSTNPSEYIRYHKRMRPNTAAIEATRILGKLSHLVDTVKLPKVCYSTPQVNLAEGQEDISWDPKKTVKEIKAMIQSMCLFIADYGNFGGALGILAYIIVLERLKQRALTQEEEALYKFSITHTLTARMILLKSMEDHDGYEKIINHSSPKILNLLSILKEYNPELTERKGVTMKVNKSRNPICAIIFTKQRFTAKIVSNLLKEVINSNPDEFGFLKQDFIVGFHVNPYNNTKEQFYFKKCSETTLLRFRNKEINCLISTSVIEEGIDVPLCTLVVRYDPPLEYRSYVQSKGRARKDDAAFVMMIDEDETAKFEKQYTSFLNTEHHIRNMLIGKNDDRDAPSARAIEELYNEDEIPPYFTEQGTRLSAVSAISLLSRYCATLPRDCFSEAAPMWVQEIHEGLRVITIHLPIASPVKQPIVGKPMASIKNAKRSAALEACKLLHRAGELDPVTMLPRQYGAVDFDVESVMECFPNWPRGEEEVERDPEAPKPGTKHSVRKYPRVFPASLKGPSCYSKTNNYYLHLIKIDPAFPEPPDTREKALYTLLKRPEGFGFLTHQSLPVLCDFPMFLTVGHVNTSIEVNYAVIALDAPLFNLVKHFHYLVFRHVLDTMKRFLVFDGKENTMYVVPVIASDGYDIDWATMQTHTSVPPLQEPTLDERKSLRVDPELYKHHVVSPWYRGTILPDRYIVSNVLEYKTPNSKFDENHFSTFADYYSSKYNLDVLGQPDQPLLEVRNISTRMNCLMPRAATIRSLSAKQQRLLSDLQGDDKPKAFPEVFIPEFCVKYDFPGVLWYKAMMLPSICHRIYMLLVANELRIEIAASTKIGQSELLSNEKWEPLEVDVEVTLQSLVSQIEDPAPICTIDRMNDNLDKEVVNPDTTPNSFKEQVFQMRKKKIDDDYPWDKDQEPIDIDHNLMDVTLVDIECYNKFVSAKMPDKAELKSRLLTPVKMPTVNTKSVAIMPPPPEYAPEIKVLSRRPTARGPELRAILAALTAAGAHDSFDMERCETLGDTFLKFAASLYLYHRFPEHDEGRLTTIKSRLIGNRNLYYAGVNKKLPGRVKVETFQPRKDFLIPGFSAPAAIKEYIEREKIRPTYLLGTVVSEAVALGEVAVGPGGSGRPGGPGGSGRPGGSGGPGGPPPPGQAGAEPEPPQGAQQTMQCYVGAQAVSDKVVADCVEALVGTYLVEGGVQAGAEVLKWFNILPMQENESFAQLLKKQPPTPLSEGITTEEDLNRLMNFCRDEVEEILHYKFKDPSLLLEALSHTSYIRNRLTRNYGRMEFLGDAILDFLITAYIFEKCRTLKPGQLTDLRSSLVNNVTFASYVVKLQLHKYICYLVTPMLSTAIMSFIQHQERRGYAIQEDVLYLIDEEDCNVADYIEVPKILSDIFESLAAAIFLDSGGNLQQVWSVYYRIMHNELEAFSQNIPLQPVRVLYEKIHACPRFGDSISKNPGGGKIMVPATFTKNGKQLTVYGFGNNKSQAKRAAAKMALKIIK